MQMGVGLSSVNSGFYFRILWIIRRLYSVHLCFTGTRTQRSYELDATMAAQVVRGLGRLTTNSCYFFLCDMQEKFRPSIRYYPEIITVAQRMVRLRHSLRSYCVVHELDYVMLIFSGKGSHCNEDSSDSY